MHLAKPSLLFLVCASPSIAAQDGTAWIDAATLTIEGKAWADTVAPYDRLPRKARGAVRAPVWQLGRDSAGMLVRFKTAATSLRVRWTLVDKTLAMAHMPATGVSGVDLYVRHEGRWRWLAVGKPTRFPDNEAALVSGLPVSGLPVSGVPVSGVSAAARDYLLYLPLYNGVSKVAIGVPAGAEVTRGTPPAHRKPLVFYGTSITQGGCASRPGMVHTAILGRALDRPVVNLGFSGNGTMDPSIAALLCEIDASCYVIDCLPNMRAAEVRERVGPLVRTLREARPDTPILLVEDRGYTNAFLRPSLAQRNRTSREALRLEFEALQGAGISGLHYMRGADLLGADGEATVDGSHPTDLGFVRQAETMGAALRQVLGGR